jgi:hypothetical protein
VSWRHWAHIRRILITPSVVDLREKAVEVALAVTSGAYQTSLLTYFIQRDMFPAVMKVGTMRKICGEIP